jgi:hypothetical protein
LRRWLVSGCVTILVLIFLRALSVSPAPRGPAAQQREPSGGIGDVVVSAHNLAPSSAANRTPAEQAADFIKVLRAGAETPTPSTPTSKWTYSTTQDQMGRKQSSAIIVSSNTLEFHFPYQGDQNSTLMIRKSSQFGTSVMVMIERGQFLCGFQGCTANVRFDSGPIQRFSASGPSDHSTTVLFLNNEARFISQLRKARIVRIEPTFYHEGMQTLEFDTDGFKWP